MCSSDLLFWPLLPAQRGVIKFAPAAAAVVASAAIVVSVQNIVFMFNPFKAGGLPACRNTSLCWRDYRLQGAQTVTRQQHSTRN